MSQSLREELIKIIAGTYIESCNKKSEDWVVDVADAILKKIAESLPKEKEIQSRSSEWVNRHKEGWNAYHTALKNTLSGDGK